MAPSACPSCGSRFLQPLRCEPKGEDEVLVELRCPECTTHLQAAFSRADIAELDRRQSAWRDEIVAAYERSVTESMEALAACLVPALDRDLIGADDFAVPSRPRLPAGS
jgi:threonine synthase